MDQGQVCKTFGGARGCTRAGEARFAAGRGGRAAIEGSDRLGVERLGNFRIARDRGAFSARMARGLRRYQCKGCGRTFNALRYAACSGLHHKERWLAILRAVARHRPAQDGWKASKPLARCDVAVSTAPLASSPRFWRRRGAILLQGIPSHLNTRSNQTWAVARWDWISGTMADTPWRLSWTSSRETSRLYAPARATTPPRNPSLDAAALAAALDAEDGVAGLADGGASYPPCAAALGVSHEARQPLVERVRGDLHVQTVNSRHVG